MGLLVEGLDIQIPADGKDNFYHFTITAKPDGRIFVMHTTPGEGYSFPKVVNVPSPHGDLIDRAELKHKLDALVKMHCDRCVDGITHRQTCEHCWTKEVKAILELTPSIIEYR